MEGIFRKRDRGDAGKNYSEIVCVRVCVCGRTLSVGCNEGNDEAREVVAAVVVVICRGGKRKKPI